jgi:hypothetical protein
MCPQEPADIIGRAASSLRRARIQWNAADLASIEANRQLLETAALDIGQLHKIIVSRPAEFARELQPAVEGLRREIAGITRISDTGNAFYRGLAMRLGALASSVYGPDGVVDASTPAAQQATDC